ncbi:MAG TPA: glycosyltransferase family 39 protein [Thermoanaerobaculia bacterium]
MLLLATGLRLGHLSSWSLNNDEIVEASWSSMSFSDMMKEVRRDAVHPPADYLVQFIVGRIGPEWVRRLPSVIAGVGTVAAVMLLGRFWLSTSAGLAAGLLMAVAPTHVWYSQEVRPYALGLFWICASLVALEIDAISQRRVWAGAWCGLVFLAGSTLYFAGMIAAAAGIFRIFIDRHDRLRWLWRRLPLIVLIWTILYAPWLTVVRHVATSPSPGPSEKLGKWWWMSRLQSLGVGNEIVIEPIDLGSWTFWFCVAIGTIISARFRLLRVAAFMFIVGTAMEIALLQIHPYYSSVRYLLPSWPAAFVLGGAAIAFLSRYRLARPIAVAALVLYVGYAAIKLPEYYRGQRSDWLSIATYVHNRVKPGDRVIATNNWVIRNFGYYWSRLPAVEKVSFSRYWQLDEDLVGPAWIVTGQCSPRDAVKPAGVMKRFPVTELAEVRYLRPGQRLSMREEFCPE